MPIPPTELHLLTGLEGVLDPPNFVGSIRVSQKRHKRSLCQVGSSRQVGKSNIELGDLLSDCCDLEVIFLELELPVEFLWEVCVCNLI